MPKDNLPSVAIFGASGAIGTALCHSYQQNGWHVTAVGRDKKPKNKLSPQVDYCNWQPRSNSSTPRSFPTKLNAIVWAQGANFSDDIFSYRREDFLTVFEANVVFILETLNAMLNSGSLADKCRMVVISSIWQEIARNKKLSYTVSKSALRGLVQSLAIDLAKLNHQINAVLPGILDTAMTRQNLMPNQIDEILKHTPGCQITSMDAICEATQFLTSKGSYGVNGQFLKIDGGFSRTFIAELNVISSDV